MFILYTTVFQSLFECKCNREILSCMSLLNKIIVNENEIVELNI